MYVDPALAPAARAEVSAALARDLAGLSALPGNLVDEILPHDSLARVELDNPRSGDVVVLLRPGFEFVRSRPSVFSVPNNRGGHGYRNATPVLDASFAAIGPGIEPSRGAVPAGR